jgi:hypothetical protein
MQSSLSKYIWILLFLPLLSFGQEAQKDSKFDLGFYMLPEINGLITGNPIGREATRNQFGGAAGLNVEYRLTSKISLRTGLGFGIRNYEHVHEGLIFNSDISPNEGMISESSIVSNINYSEIQLPLLFQYNINSNFFFTLGLELTTIFNDNSERVIFYGNGTTEEIKNNNIFQSNVGPLLSIGYQIPNSNFLIEPLLKYYLRDQIIVSSNQYNYGLKITYNLAL